VQAARQLSLTANLLQQKRFRKSRGGAVMSNCRMADTPCATPAVGQDRPAYIGSAPLNMRMVFRKALSSGHLLADAARSLPRRIRPASRGFE
jgi:hypothetical protein